eukprot:1161541-Pelagomonas_calceolata.AAC.9
MACAAGGCTARLWDAEHMQTSIRSYEMRECTLCVVLECALDACSELKVRHLLRRHLRISSMSCLNIQQHLCWVDGACTECKRKKVPNFVFCSHWFLNFTGPECYITVLISTLPEFYFTGPDFYSACASGLFHFQPVSPYPSFPKLSWTLAKAGPLLEGQLHGSRDWSLSLVAHEDAGACHGS